jgi:catechol 2,3-dioxygenase
MPHRPLSTLSHVELRTPSLADSVGFAHDMLGLHVVAEIDNSVYMRCWGDHYSYSLVFTQAAEPGLGHVAFRTWNAEQLEIAVASVEAAGTKGEWKHDSFGHGPAYRFVGPAGHTTELFWEVDRAVAPPGEASIYPELPQRASSHGIGVRMLDHLTVTAPDVKAAMYWHRDVLDFRLMAAVEPAPGEEWFFGVATNTEKSHDFGFIRDMEGQFGRLHHLAFWAESNQDLVQGAKFLLERGCDIDYGPGQHGIGEQHYLYFRDPVGLRYELNSSGYRNYVPDWEPVIWTPDDGPNNTYRTEIGMPAVHMVTIPPGEAGKSEDKPLEGFIAKS